MLNEEEEGVDNVESKCTSSEDSFTACKIWNINILLEHLENTTILK